MRRDPGKKNGPGDGTWGITVRGEVRVAKFRLVDMKHGRSAWFRGRPPVRRINLLPSCRPIGRRRSR